MEQIIATESRSNCALAEMETDPYGVGQCPDESETMELLPPEMRVLTNHIYELKKGVRQMALFTCKRRYEHFATERLRHNGFASLVQPAGRENVNIYFGRRECLNAIRLFVTRPLNELSPEEDFILGAMLGYDICTQCERYCQRKRPGTSC